MLFHQALKPRNQYSSLSLSGSITRMHLGLNIARSIAIALHDMPIEHFGIDSERDSEYTTSPAVTRSPWVSRPVFPWRSWRRPGLCPNSDDIRPPLHALFASVLRGGESLVSGWIDMPVL